MTLLNRVREWLQSLWWAIQDSRWWWAACWRRLFVREIARARMREEFAHTVDLGVREAVAEWRKTLEVRKDFALAALDERLVTFEAGASEGDYDSFVIREVVTMGRVMWAQDREERLEEGRASLGPWLHFAVGSGRRDEVERMLSEAYDAEGAHLIDLALDAGTEEDLRRRAYL